VASLYVTLISAALSGKASSGKEGYYFTETGSRSWKELADALTPVLFAKGLVTSKEATPYASLAEAAGQMTGGSEGFAAVAFASKYVPSWSLFPLQIEQRD